MYRPEEIRVFGSLLRPNLFMGCDRELIMCAALLCTVTWYMLMSVAGTVVCALIFGTCLYILRRLAEEDPLYSRVHIRAMRLKRFYKAQGRD